MGPDVRAYTRVEALVATGLVDAIYVNTPVAAHADVCLPALRAGCAVICEKPLAPTATEAAALSAAAASAGVRTAVNFTYRSVPGFRLTEQYLAEPGIGRPLAADFALLQGHDFLPGFPRASALLDSGVHLLDTLAALTGLAGMGTVAEVCAVPLLDATRAAPAAPARPLAAGDAVGQIDYGWSFIARTAYGGVVSGRFSRRALGWRNGLCWRIDGADGALAVELDGERTTVRHARRGEGRPQGEWRALSLPADLVADDARFAQYHLDRLVGAVRGEEAFPDFAAALATQRLADALASSAASGRWEPLVVGDGRSDAG
jgi:predicted dehydrogenase